MSYTAALLIPGTLLPNAVASQGGPVAPAKWLVKRAVIVNTDSAIHQVTIYRVPSGGSSGIANEVLAAYSLSTAGNQGASYVVAELSEAVLNAGDTIQAFADTANKVSIACYGFTF